jgi:hypothetical protein
MNFPQEPLTCLPAEAMGWLGAYREQCLCRGQSPLGSQR